MRTKAMVVLVMVLVASAWANAAMLSGSFTDPNPDNPTVVSSVGTVDWAVWGAASDNSLTPYAQKDDGGGSAVGLIPSLSLVGSYTPTAMSQWDIGNLVDLSWSGGVAPNTSATASQNPSLNARGAASGDGFSISLPAGTAVQRAVFYVSAYNRKGEFTASLSDDSATDYFYEWDILNGERSAIFTVDYVAASDNETLDITWIATQSNNPFSSVGIQAIALTVPEPATMAILGLGGLGVLLRKRRR